MYRTVEESEQFGVRRSTRALEHPDSDEKASNLAGPANVEYFSSCCLEWKELPGNRREVEVAREQLHETNFAKLYQAVGENLISVSGDGGCTIGQFWDGSFPPFLGRVVTVQSASFAPSDKVSWEIREECMVAALRWVIRGLIQSEHLTQFGPRETLSDLGVIVPNHIYYIDESEVPFDILDVKELTRQNGLAMRKTRVVRMRYNSASTRRLGQNVLPATHRSCRL